MLTKAKNFAEFIEIRNSRGYQPSTVSEIYLDLEKGEVKGNIEGVTNEQLAEALEDMAECLRLHSGRLSYICFDEGKISVGY